MSYLLVAFICLLVGFVVGIGVMAISAAEIIRKKETLVDEVKEDDKEFNIPKEPRDRGSYGYV
jgi:hypothetical protein